MEIFVGPKYRKHRSSSFCDGESTSALDILLCNTSMPHKIVNCLDSQDILTLGDLALKDSEFILGLKNSGEVTLRCCKEVLDTHGVKHLFDSYFISVNGVVTFKRPAQSRQDAPKPPNRRRNYRNSIDVFDLFSDLQ